MEKQSKLFTQSVLFEKVSFVSIISTLVLGIIAFTTPTFLDLAVVKTFIIEIGIAVSVIFFTLSKIKSKSFELSLNPLVLVSFATIITILASAFLSPNFASSFIGKSFSVDTGLFLVVLFVSGFLSFALVKGNEDRMFFIFVTLLGTFALLAIYHIIRFFAGAGFLSLGTFTSMTYTAIGSWHDLGIFAGLSFILSFLTIQSLPITNKLARSFFVVVFVLATIILFVADLSSVWALVAITMFGFAIYTFFSHQKKNNVFIIALIIGVVSSFLAWSPGQVGSFISTHIVEKADASYVEVNLPWQMTIDIAEPTIKNFPFLGAGPARFSNQYLQYKPEIVNATQFWSTDFSNGSSFILTSLVTEGMLGFVLWIVFIVLFIIYAMRTFSAFDISESSPNTFVHYTALTSFFGASFLLLSILNYMPSHAILLVTFVLSGVCIANMNFPVLKKINFSEGRSKIITLVVLWVIVVASLGLVVVCTKNTLAQIYFQKAVQNINTGGSINSSAKYMQVAIKLNPTDTYYQTISQMDIYVINQIIANATTTPNQTTVQLIGGLVSDGINSARLAEKFDPTNTYNYITEGQISTVAAGIGMADAYGNATSTFQKAITLDPLDPSIYLSLSKLEFFEKNDSAAKNYLNAALQIKPDYTDAIFEAGVISYADKDYTTAVNALTQVAKLQSDYPNIQHYISMAQSAENNEQIAPVPKILPKKTN